MENSKVEAARAALKSQEPDPDTFVFEQARQIEFKQLVRNIGAETTMEVENVVSVDAYITGLMEQGWEIITAHPLAAVPGGVMIYYALVRSEEFAPPGEG